MNWPWPWPLGWHARTDDPDAIPDPARFETPACGGPDRMPPAGGLWTSPILFDTQTLWSSYGIKNNMSGFNFWHAWQLEWPPADQTAVIDSERDLHQLIDAYPCRLHRSKRTGYDLCAPWRPYEDPNLPVHETFLFPAMDYTALAGDFAALYLTEAGRQATWGKDPGTSAFEVETVLWLRPQWKLGERIDIKPLLDR